MTLSFPLYCIIFHSLSSFVPCHLIILLYSFVSLFSFFTKLHIHLEFLHNFIFYNSSFLYLFVYQKAFCCRRSFYGFILFILLAFFFLSFIHLFKNYFLSICIFFLVLWLFFIHTDVTLFLGFILSFNPFINSFILSFFHSFVQFL